MSRLLFSLLSPAPHYWRKAIHFSVLGNSISLNPNPIPCRFQKASDGTKCTMKGENADGRPISHGFTVKFDGKDYPAAGTMPGGADSISIKKVDANHYEATLKKAGKEVSACKLEISKDGKWPPSLPRESAQTASPRTPSPPSTDKNRARSLTSHTFALNAFVPFFFCTPPSPTGTRT